MNKDLLKFLRVNKGMTQKELGELIGVSHATINSYEKGRKPIPANRVRQFYKVFGAEYIEHAKLFLEGGSLNGRV